MNDCFALRNRECVILNHKACEGCNFYKTKKQLKKEREESNVRIGQLDSHMQAYITDKYGYKY